MYQDPWLFYIAVKLVSHTHIYIYIYLVGGFNPLGSWDYYSQYIYIWNNKKCSKPPTKHIYIYIIIHSGYNML